MDDFPAERGLAVELDCVAGVVVVVPGAAKEQPTRKQTLVSDRTAAVVLLSQHRPSRLLQRSHTPREE